MFLYIIYYNRIATSEGIDKSNESKECAVCH